MKKLVYPFKKAKYLEFIKALGWNSIENWVDFCEGKNLILNLEKLKENRLKDDWIWCVLFPLLSQAYNIYNVEKKRKIIGITALPGTGKSTLGSLIEKLSASMDIKITVLSIDDFYLPNKQMLMAINNNPWNVSRGFPGSHSTLLMKEKLLIWKDTGKLNFPTFDKSINNGFGDRANWRNESPDVLILEGWFLGVKPYLETKNEINAIVPPLSNNEIKYRLKIQKNLIDYIDIWDLVDNIWHLKPEKFSYLNQWKRQQEKEMLQNKGVSLSEENLINFLRMLNVSLPQNSFANIKADFVFSIDQNRKLTSLTFNKLTF